MANVVIINPSSPGASLTQNTNKVILCCYNYTQEHPSDSMMFIDFRRAMSKQYKLNDNNCRNIYPLLRNMGFVQYEPQTLLSLSSFFTNVGLAYVKTLTSIENVIDSPELDYDKRKIVLQKYNSVKANICFIGLKNIIKNPSVNYAAECMAYLRFLQRFHSINKTEAALLVYFREQYPDDYLDKMESTIDSLRNGTQHFEIKVDVRNDEQTGDGSGNERRVADIGCFTSYGYITNLIKDAGLVEGRTTLELVTEKKDKVDELIQEN